MIHHVTYKNLDPIPGVEPVLTKKIQKLETLLSSFAEDAVALQITFERHPRREEYYVSLTLSLPQCQLRAEDKGFDPLRAMNLAFDEVIREVKKFKDRLKREYAYRDRRVEKLQYGGESPS